MPPLWVFTPPVALNIACSQASPVGLIANSVCGAGKSAVAFPCAKKRGNQGETARILAINSAMFISRCAPLFSPSTSPGFGVNLTSRYIASAASQAMLSVAQPVQR
jgi:hypothetical protein